MILIADGPYSKCDYSSVDKKVKASITKLFAKPPTPTTPKVPPTKSSKTTKQPKEKKGTTASAKKIVATPPIQQVPVAVAEEKPSIVLPPSPTPSPSPTPQPVSVVEEKKTKPTSTIVRRRVAKNQPEPVQAPTPTPTPTPTTEIGISNQKEKPTSTIVRKKKTTV